MKVMIRADASYQIGGGHVTRCLTLAEELRRTGADVLFVCTDEPGHLGAMITEKQFPLLLVDRYDNIVDIKRHAFMKDKIDWVIVDHYSLDEKWERQLRGVAMKIAVIDDLANRSHDCDVLLDYNVVQNSEHRYKGLIPKQCHCFLGPQHAMLKQEYYDTARLARDSGNERVLVFYGSSDPTGETLKALHALAAWTDLKVDVVVGMNNPMKGEISTICDDRSGYRFHCQIDYMPRLMQEAYISLGAGGVTALERCKMSLPTLVTVVAANQIPSAVKLAELGALHYIGWHERVDVETIQHALQLFLNNPSKVRDMSRVASEIMRNALRPGGEFVDYILA